MRTLTSYIFAWFMITWCTTQWVHAGPYPPAAGQVGSTAISKDSSEFTAWASGWINLSYGSDVDGTYQTPQNAMGTATGSSLDIVCLGRGGTITLTFAAPIRNGSGWDFSVFENSFSDLFLELAYVEVSSNGMDFTRFRNHSLTAAPVSEFGHSDPTDIDGLAGKYRAGYGTPFDLDDLARSESVINGLLDLSAVSHVKLVDVVGDGNSLDSQGNPIYDPYPTHGSAGFDLEALGVRYQNTGYTNSVPYQPQLDQPANFGTGISMTPQLSIDPFSDPDTDDEHLMTRWQIGSNAAMDAGSLIFQNFSVDHLRNITLPDFILQGLTPYYWRVSVYDKSGKPSPWSDTYSFTTASAPADNTISRDWDGDGSLESDIRTLETIGLDNISRYLGIRADSGVQLVRLRHSVTGEVYFSDPTNTKTLSDGIYTFEVTLDAGHPSGQVSLFVSPGLDSDERWYFYDPFTAELLDSEVSYDDKRLKTSVTLSDGTTDTRDLDGLKNGKIVFMGGRGKISEPPAPKSDEEGFDDKGGCFVNTIDPGSGGDGGKSLSALVAFLCMAGIIMAARERFNAA